MGDYVTDDFNRLQAVSQQFAPQPHHYHGPSAGTVAWLGANAYLIARNAQQRRDVAAGLRPGDLKHNVLTWYLLVAAGLHLLFGCAYSTGWFFLWGSIVWIPTWILGIYHQRQVNAWNKAAWARHHDGVEYYYGPADFPFVEDELAPLAQWQALLGRESRN